VGRAKGGWVTTGADVGSTTGGTKVGALVAVGSGCAVGSASGFVLPGAVVAAMRLKTTVSAVAPTAA